MRTACETMFFYTELGIWRCKCIKLKWRTLYARISYLHNIYAVISEEKSKNNYELMVT